MSTAYTWKVTTLEHDRALETYLNKANAEEGWEIVFILPGARAGHSTVVARKAVEVTPDASRNRSAPDVLEPAVAILPVVQSGGVPPKPERNGRRSGKTASKRGS
jgi:hypothetical protein